MKKFAAEKLEIPIGEFLFMNGHTLMDRNNPNDKELQNWRVFFNYLSYCLETDEFKVRGSCIARAVIEILAESKSSSLDDREELANTDINKVLYPYAEVSEIYREDKTLKDKLSNEEWLFFNIFLMGVHKPNIDFYYDITEITQVDLCVEQLNVVFPKKFVIDVGTPHIFPNGIAAIRADMNGGYPSHNVNMILKPEVSPYADLRRNLSVRQLASIGKLVQRGAEWYIVIDGKDVNKILATDSLQFIDKPYIGSSELLFQAARSLRFNAIYTVLGVEVLNESELKRVTDQISLYRKPLRTYGKESSYIHAQTMNENMISFLHNPRLFISYVQQLPEWALPYINREALLENEEKICSMLKGGPKDYHITSKDKHIDLTRVASLMVGKKSNSLFSSKVGQHFKPIIDSIDLKLGGKLNNPALSEILELENTYNSWDFANVTDYYLFQMLFYPVELHNIIDTSLE